MVSTPLGRRTKCVCGPHAARQPLQRVLAQIGHRVALSPDARAATGGRPEAWPTRPRGRGCWRRTDRSPDRGAAARPASPGAPRRRTRPNRTRTRRRSPARRRRPPGSAPAATSDDAPPERAAAASNAAAPSTVDAYTTSSSGGNCMSRLWTKDWMPPTRGGKSFVMTSVRLIPHTGPRSGSYESAPPAGSQAAGSRTSAGAWAARPSCGRPPAIRPAPAPSGRPDRDSAGIRRSGGTSPEPASTATAVRSSASRSTPPGCGPARR